MQLFGPATILCATLLSAPSSDWPRFRGPGGRGLAPDDRPLPARLGPDERCFETPLGPGHSSPCIAGERIYLTEWADGELRTVALDRADGRVLWRRGIAIDEPERHHDVNSPAAATPTSDGARVFCAFGSSGLVAYDADGRELWRREPASARNTFGSASSPVLCDGRLIWVRDAESDSFIEALEPATGRVLWRRARPGLRSAWSTPALRDAGDGPELLVYGYKQLAAYGLEDGRERWSVPGLADEPIVVPTTDAELVFVTSYNMRTNPEVEGLPTFEDLLAAHDVDGDGRLDRDEAARNRSVLSRHDADGEGDHPLSIFFRFLDVDEDGAIEAAEWPKLGTWLASFEHANAILAIRPPGADAREPRIVWQFPRGVPECPSPVVVGGRIYAVKNGGLITCLDARTGAPCFEGRLDSRGPHYASLVHGDGKLFAASARGIVTVFEAGPELRVLEHNDLGERILATPALCGGRVYVRTETSLQAFASAR